jgi:GAF domain-containing protein
MDTQPTPTADIEPIGGSEDPFPFRRELSLQPLIAFWEQAKSDRDPVRAALARSIREEIAKAPELLAPIRDLTVLERHRPLVDALMSAVFPRAFWGQDFSAALVPFDLRSFYATPSFEHLLMADNGRLRGRLSVDEPTLQSLRLLHGYGQILGRFYGIRLDLKYPMILTVPDPENGLDRHFKMGFDGLFLAIEAVGGPPVLSEAARQRLTANPFDLSALTELLPPERFVFRGFSVSRAVEVTEQEILSALKRDLIERESIMASGSFHRLQGRLQALFRRPDLRLGLAAIDGDQVFLLNSAYRLEHGCIFADSSHHRLGDFAGSVFEHACEQGRPLFIEDLATYPQRGAHEEVFLRAGARNMVVAPLFYQEALIGTLHLSSPRPGDIGPAQAMALDEVLPLFSMAVKRGMDELNTRIQAFIKEHCTAIHPSVEWRFRRAVLKSIERVTPGSPVALEPIVFEDIYPLYGVTDIRGSSTERNLAIQADLTEHLMLAEEVLRAAHRAKDLPILDALAHQVGRHAESLALGLRSGDEVATLGFLRQRVEPILEQMRALGAGVPARVEAYRAALDPKLGTVYRRRRGFDESVALINETISSYLEAEEERAQAMFPHYFEKQQTDGVDFGMYIGPSLVESGGFDPLYLHNLRLWQLMVMCGIARRAEALKPRLPVALDTTHLILAQHTPLAIRFRLDEKRFDVDGAYNVRYEVIKKRIDKATVRGTEERLTQPGRIAIVYTQPREAAEYREYIEYLQARGALMPGVEGLELGQLQGVDGLRALRVAVNLEGPSPDTTAALGRSATTHAGLTPSA